MMSEEEVSKETCYYAIAGGNSEIVRLCEQKGISFEGCLNVSVSYHHFNLFEWLNQHFDFNDISLPDCIACDNEPIFYLHVSRGGNVEAKDKYENTPLICASENDNLDVVKYLVEQCHANVEAKNIDGYTPLIRASWNGHLDVVKYLVEQCHANVEAKDNDG